MYVYTYTCLGLNKYLYIYFLMMQGSVVINKLKENEQQKKSYLCQFLDEY